MNYKKVFLILVFITPLVKLYATDVANSDRVAEEMGRVDSEDQGENTLNITKLHNELIAAAHRHFKLNSPESLNRSKNELSLYRYYDIYSPVETRVKLEDNPFSYCRNDFIHANYIDQGRIISTQSPTINTEPHFWQMVYEQKSKMILNLTSNEDLLNNKTIQYWPTLNSYRLKEYPLQDLGYKFAVKLISEKTDQQGIFTIRTFLIEKYKILDKIYANPLSSMMILDKAEDTYTIINKIEPLEDGHEVTMIHFNNWPDTGVIDIEQAKEIRAKVREEYLNEDSPLVIHCSAGVGRTGTIAAYLKGMEMIDNGQGMDLDIPKIVFQLKRERGEDTVQSSMQLKFLFKALRPDILLGE